MSELLQMYLLFFRMGAVTFGGGYAMLPILRREIIESRRFQSYVGKLCRPASGWTRRPLWTTTPSARAFPVSSP